jgi:hypothetical protein
MHKRNGSKKDQPVRSGARASQPPPGAKPEAWNALVGFYGEKMARRLAEEIRIMTESRLSVSDFLRVGAEIGELVASKNTAYGDSFAQSCRILEVLYPSGVRIEQYRDMLGVVRVIDKLFRIATRKDAFGESPWRDIAGYGVVATVADERAQSKSRKSIPIAIGPNLRKRIRRLRKK